MGRKALVAVLIVGVLAIVGFSLAYSGLVSGYGGDSSYGNFTSDKCLLYGDYGTGGVDIAARDNNVYVVVAPHMPGMNGIWFRKSADYGANWGPWVRVHESLPYNVEDPQIALGSSQNTLFVACDGNYNSSSVGSDITIFKSDDAGSSWNTYYRIASYQQDANSIYSYIDPSLSYNAGRIMLTYTRRSYNPQSAGYYATLIYGFQVEPSTGLINGGAPVSNGIWNYSSRCAVATDGSYWFTWKNGNVWDGNVYAVHYNSNGTSELSRVFLSGSASHPDIGVSASGVVNVVYNRWDGFNHWACVRGTQNGRDWWAEQLLKAPEGAGGGSNNHCPRICHNSTDSSGDLLLGWAAYRTAWSGDFSGSTFRWGGETCHDLGTVMNLQSAGGFNPNIEQYQTFDVCTNGIYHYMVAENGNGSIWVKRNDFTPPQCDSVTAASSAGGAFGGIRYTNTNFNVSYNVRDDWDVTSSQPYDAQPPMGPDTYTRGVTTLRPTMNGGNLPDLSDDSDRDGNWGVSVDVAVRPDGNYQFGGTIWDTAGNEASIPNSHTVVVDRVLPNCTAGILIDGQASSGIKRVNVSSAFEVAFANPQDNLDLNSSGEVVHGIANIDVYRSKSRSGPWTHVTTIAPSSAWHTRVLMRDTPDGTYYFKGDIKDAAGNVAPGGATNNRFSGPVVVSHNDPPPTVDSISPDEGAYEITCDIAGSNFREDAPPTVQLAKSGLDPIEGTVNSVTPTNINCSFNIVGVPNGPRDLVVTHEDDGKVNTKTDAFTVVYDPVKGDGIHYLGLKPTSNLTAYRHLSPRAAGAGGTALPPSTDLSGDLPPVGNQGKQGSCVGWAVSYYYKSWQEKQEAKAKGDPNWNLNDPRYQYSPSFMYNQIVHGNDSGTTFDEAFNLLDTKGDVDIAEFLYDQNNYIKKPTPEQLEAAKQYWIPDETAGGWAYLNPRNLADFNEIKSCLANGKMLVIGIPVFENFRSCTSYFVDVPTGYFNFSYGNHALCIVGYDDAAGGGKGGFKIVNSWGTTWGQGGFTYLSYDFVKNYADKAWSMNDLSSAPEIRSISPDSGNWGDPIYIYGNNFGTLRRNANVIFAPDKSTITTSWTNNRITVNIPGGATSPVVVSDWHGDNCSITFKIIGFEGVPETPLPFAVQQADFASWGDSVYAFFKGSDGFMYFARSDDCGKTWPVVRYVGSDPASASSPQIVCMTPWNVFVAWRQVVNNAYWTVEVCHSNNSGNSWSYLGQISNAFNAYQSLSMDYSPSGPIMVWDHWWGGSDPKRCWFTNASTVPNCNYVLLPTQEWDNHLVDQDTRPVVACANDIYYFAYENDHVDSDYSERECIRACAFKVSTGTFLAWNGPPNDPNRAGRVNYDWNKDSMSDLSIAPTNLGGGDFYLCWDLEYGGQHYVRRINLLVNGLVPSKGGEDDRLPPVYDRGMPVPCRNWGYAVYREGAPNTVNDMRTDPDNPRGIQVFYAPSAASFDDIWLEKDPAGNPQNYLIAKTSPDNIPRLKKDCPPVMNSITPNSGASNESVHITNLSGSLFEGVTVAKLKKSGEYDIDGTNIRIYDNGTRMECDFDLTNKPDGKWDVYLQNGAGEWRVLAESFTIYNLDPVIDSVSPAKGSSSQYVTCDISGSHFRDDPPPEVRLVKAGEDPRVGWINTVTSSNINCDFDLSDAAAGTWDLVVTQPDDGKSATKTGAFTIEPPALTVTTIVPNSGTKGTTVQVSNLTGTGFLPGAEVRLEQGGTTIGATNLVVVSATKITCSFNLTDPQGQPARPTGWYMVVVKNLDGQEGKLTPQGFQVNSPSTGPCGTGAGASLPLLGALMGFLSLASSKRVRKRLRGRRMTRPGKDPRGLST